MKHIQVISGDKREFPKILDSKSIVKWAGNEPINLFEYIDYESGDNNTGIKKLTSDELHVLHNYNCIGALLWLIYPEENDDPIFIVSNTKSDNLDWNPFEEIEENNKYIPQPPKDYETAILLGCCVGYGLWCATSIGKNQNIKWIDSNIGSLYNYVEGALSIDGHQNTQNIIKNIEAEMIDNESIFYICKQVTTDFLQIYIPSYYELTLASLNICKKEDFEKTNIYKLLFKNLETRDYCEGDNGSFCIYLWTSNQSTWENHVNNAIYFTFYAKLTSNNTESRYNYHSSTIHNIEKNKNSITSQNDGTFNIMDLYFIKFL